VGEGQPKSKKAEEPSKGETPRAQKNGTLRRKSPVQETGKPRARTGHTLFGPIWTLLLLEGTTRTKEKEEAAFPAEYSLGGGVKRALFGPGVAEPPGLLAPAGVREPLLEGRHRHRGGGTAAVERGEGGRSRGGGRSGGEGSGRGRRRRGRTRSESGGGGIFHCRFELRDPPPARLQPPGQRLRLLLRGPRRGGGSRQLRPQPRDLRGEPSLPRAPRSGGGFGPRQRRPGLLGLGSHPRQLVLDSSRTRLWELRTPAEGGPGARRGSVAAARVLAAAAAGPLGKFAHAAVAAGLERQRSGPPSAFANAASAPETAPASPSGVASGLATKAATSAPAAAAALAGRASASASALARKLE
jgi:hypothetical protein